jgi:hypothetical protein
VASPDDVKGALHQKIPTSEEIESSAEQDRPSRKREKGKHSRDKEDKEDKDKEREQQRDRHKKDSESHVSKINQSVKVKDGRIRVSDNLGARKLETANAVTAAASPAGEAGGRNRGAAAAAAAVVEEAPSSISINGEVRNNSDSDTPSTPTPPSL